MFCVNCGIQLKDGAKFCSFCGVPAAPPIPEPTPQDVPEPAAGPAPEPISEYVPESAEEILPAAAPEPVPAPVERARPNRDYFPPDFIPAPAPEPPRPAPARPAYDQNLFTEPKGPNDSTAMPVAALVFGILSLIFCVFPPLGLIFSILAVVFGGLGLKKRLRGMAIAGLVIGIVMLLINIILLATLIAAGSALYGVIQGVMRNPALYY